MERSKDLHSKIEGAVLQLVPHYQKYIVFCEDELETLPHNCETPCNKHCMEALNLQLEQ